MPDDHSKLAPLLPIPNRTVKRLSADDSAGSRVKVGHRQALMPKTPTHLSGRFSLCSDKATELLPSWRNSLNYKKSVTRENDGHENQ
jgi:hypothetical protein